MICNANILLDIKFAEQSYKSIEPDNKEVPEYLNVECKLYDRDKIVCVITVTECENPKRILTLRNTIDEIILAIKTVHETLKKIESMTGKDL